MFVQYRTQDKKLSSIEICEDVYMYIEHKMTRIMAKFDHY